MKDRQIDTKIVMKGLCPHCANVSCCGFFSMRKGRTLKPTPVQIQMKRGCSDCKGSCCDYVLLDGPRNLNKTSMITYL